MNVKLECKDLIKIYQAESKLKVPALRGIDLKIMEGELIAVIGPSGAGKSTFINCIGMLDRPSAGEIIYTANSAQILYSRATVRQLIRLRRKIFGFLFQLPEHNLLYHLTALQNVTYPMKLSSKYSRTEKIKRATELMKIVGIEKRANHKPSQLSGGEAQRLGLCIALANDPEVVLADEPTGELDSLNTFAMIKYLRELNQQLGKTIIVVTHDYRFAAMTDVTYEIQDGKITAVHKPKNSEKSFIDREEFAYVSEDGMMKIPDAIRKKYAIKRNVRLELAEGYFKVIPEQEEEKRL